MTNALTQVDSAPNPDAPASEPFQLLIVTGAAGDSPADCHERTQLPIARQGQAIARILVPGAVKLGDNVELSADGQQVLAAASGQVRVRDNRIWVEHILEIRGDVDYSTGSVEFEQDIIIRGSILDLFRVVSGGSIKVGRAVESAEVRAAVDLLVAGAIAGKDKGSCVAGRNVAAKHISGATVEAGNDVIARTEVCHSRIICGGQLKVETGAVRASHVTAVGGVHCGVLGCMSSSRTTVEAGIDEPLRRLATATVGKIKNDRQQIDKLRQTLEPLMRNQKALTAQQKERATELLFRANEVEEGHQKTVDELRSRSEESATRVREQIQVEHALCAGVIIRFPGLEATVPSVVQGPIRIAPSKDQTDRRIEILRPGRGAAGFALETRCTSDDVKSALHMVLAKRT